MEKAFKVKKDSRLYRDYFISDNEKRKFQKLGDAFF